MVYSTEQLKAKLFELIETFETEAVEFKEAKSNYNFNDIGKYFSALSNEANLRSLNEAWLVFGVTNKKKICGSSYRKDKAGGSLQGLKKEIAASTNERLTFMEIYEVELDEGRVVMFQIPPANPGIPTTWNGAAYAREGESTCPLPINKMDIIRSQIGMDWSKEIISGASLADLDPDAIKYARPELVDSYSFIVVVENCIVVVVCTNESDAVLIHLFNECFSAHAVCPSCMMSFGVTEFSHLLECEVGKFFVHKAVS